MFRLPFDICFLVRGFQGFQRFCCREADYLCKESVLIKLEPTAMEINSLADFLVCNLEIMISEQFQNVSSIGPFAKAAV